MDRRLVPVSLWPGLEAELERDLVGEPVSRSSMISTVLVGSMGALMAVASVGHQSLSVSSMEDAADALDAATRMGQPV